MAAASIRHEDLIEERERPCNSPKNDMSYYLLEKQSARLAGCTLESFAKLKRTNTTVRISGLHEARHERGTEIRPENDYRPNPR